MKGVADLLAPGIAALDADHLAKIFDAEQCRLAPLPSEGNFGRILMLNVLTQAGLEDLIRHLEILTRGKKFLLLQIEAVGAV